MHKVKQVSFVFVLISFSILFFGVLLPTYVTPTNGHLLAATFNPADTSQVYLPLIQSPEWISGPSWPMVAANPQRTSWTSTQVSGNVHVEWYRPIEAYIPQNAQIIAEYGLLYISTSKGLLTLNAANGDIVWRFDTELPLGNSPTVVNGVVYVGGFDRKLHALDAFTGEHLWSFDAAGSGYDTNPLVIDNKVFVGNRDGKMYAIGAHRTPQQGQLIWQYATNGPIHTSAAYQNGVIYFASNDMHAYALNATTGALVWQSAKMPGMQFQSYWPVVYDDTVIFSAAHGYREGLSPGIGSVDAPDGGSGYGRFREMQLDNIFPNGSEGDTMGTPVTSPGWAHGYQTVNAHTITEYLENSPQPDPYKHKPWRRTYVILSQSNGIEFTFDSDQDGYPEYMPAGYWGTGSGNRYPPIIGADGILYHNNVYQCCSDSKGRVMGWNIDQPNLLSITGGYAATVEPQAISAGGNLIYRSLTNDRIGDWFNYMNPHEQPGRAWSYNLQNLAPNYDPMWFIDPDAISRHRGWYTGNIDSVNASYHNGGVQNPIVPYQGRLYIHRSNAVFAFGTSNGRGLLPLVTANSGESTAVTLAETQIHQRLETEVQKMINAGHLRPGYYNVPQFIVFGMIDYFDNPGDTLYTLSLAYPYLSTQLQTQLRAYLQTEFNTYFDNEMFARIGWEGASREAMDLPPEVASDIAAGNYPPSVNPGSGFLWRYPQHNFYAMWKYAQNVPGVNALTLYNLAKPKLQVPVPNPPVGDLADYLLQQPYELNAWISGYTGFLELQVLAGKDDDDAALRTQVINERNRLLQLRVSTFSKDSYWSDPSSPNYRPYKKHFDVPRNFVFLTPELADYLESNIRNQVVEAIEEYEYIAPYWFVSRYEATLGEGSMSNLYMHNALFQAKAQILCESQAELSKYLDVPGFARGDLLYMQNLVAALESAQYPACQ
jgi:outer membrane protein assembly factor BamB